MTSLRIIWLSWLLISPLVAEVIEQSVEYAGVKFRLVRVELERVELAWKNQAGEPYRTFEGVRADYAAAGRSVKFLMNAGIFEPGGIPSGLHLERGKTLHPLNLADAPGNFFLKPNGVIWIEKQPKKTAFIAPSADFAAREQAANVEFEMAVQSGPLLLIHGQRHPAFREGSANKLHRNGVGVDSANRLVFAITAGGEMVNLWDFAGLFLKLDCRDALFLDGDISQMEVNPKQGVESNLFGAIFVVSAP